MVTPQTMTFNTENVKVYLAAAGAGKTTALMREMVKLLEKYRPDETAFVTYTRKGVEHGIEQALLVNPQLSVEDLPYFKTLHALCFKGLGLKQKHIITRADINKFNKLFGFNLTLSDAYEQQTNDDRMMIRYDVLRAGSKKGIFVHDKTFDEGRYKYLTKTYEMFKEANHLVDFHDCLSQFREKNEPINVKVAFIDEAQDLTLLQWEVCKIAFSKCEKIIIAGDDYQSLFSYAGASPKTLICLAEKYKTIKFETSYRLPKEVYKFAKGITHLIADKIDKDFKPAKDVDGFVKEMPDKYLLARQIQKDIKSNGYSSYRWFLLFRNNCFINEMTNYLEQLKIPYHTAKGFVIADRELKKIKRYYNFRKEGFGDKEVFNRFCKEYNIEDINNDFTESDLIPSSRRYIYFDYVQEYGIDRLEEISTREPYVLLATTHRVKGGEADFVATFLDCTKQVYNNRQVNLDEELRVLYVACSRARVGLYLVPSKKRYGLNEVVELVKEQVA